MLTIFRLHTNALVFSLYTFSAFCVVCYDVKGRGRTWPTFLMPLCNPAIMVWVVTNQFGTGLNMFVMLRYATTRYSGTTIQHVFWVTDGVKLMAIFLSLSLSQNEIYNLGRHSPMSVWIYPHASRSISAHKKRGAYRLCKFYARKCRQDTLTVMPLRIHASTLVAPFAKELFLNFLFIVST